MATYILLHGAWHWGGCFQKVATELAALGHRVSTPDLASHGFDPTPPEQVTSLAQYTANARRLIEASDERVILLGHSMGGVSATYLAELLAPKIAAVVYLTALMAPDGKIVSDYMPSMPGVESDATATGLMSLIVPDGACLRLKLAEPQVLRAAFYDDCSDHDFAIAQKNLSALQPVPDIFAPAVTTARYAALRRVYIECTQDRAIAITAQRAMQADNPGTEVFTLNASHSPFFSQPQELAGILASLAAGKNTDDPLPDPVFL